VNGEAKTRYRAVENTTTMGCNARNTNKQTNNKLGAFKLVNFSHLIFMNYRT
jgi:hypothetical protein